MSLYSLVVWPPDELDGWLTRHQAALGVAGYGPPHLNVRTPFQWDGDESDLAARFRRALDGVRPFDVRVKGWRRFPHVFFLEMQRTPELLDLHERALAVEALPGGTRDGSGFIPHLTMALGVCSWAENPLWAQVALLDPPLMGWRVREVALTREHQGALIEVRRYPLT
ncbi:2'-5' RNA ligase family protein [Deinococcus maricopensis]|uniref:Phosphoesterase HXTX n=1 Tax=Deinococcus maricopensis (strain DSM 21211 / LMG 22137 / NRRL B-23946 / LB-34) TaxID=709986 RepID=E8U895_DEIML|nr:2'-5' RNA ligase family protein [Deinococcus maricopensis]ADV67284.1 hypothetical protein Deima_1635 [Deinococcus maricopensis DSM 21211]